MKDPLIHYFLIEAFAMSLFSAFSARRKFFVAARVLATYLVPGCVGRGVRLGSENSSGGAGGAGAGAAGGGAWAQVGGPTLGPSGWAHAGPTWVGPSWAQVGGPKLGPSGWAPLGLRSKNKVFKLSGR